MAAVGSSEHDNFTRLCRLLIDEGTLALQDVLKTTLQACFPNQTLSDVLNTASVQCSLKQALLNQQQKRILFPRYLAQPQTSKKTKVSRGFGPADPNLDIKRLDITLLCTLLKYMFSPPCPNSPCPGPKNSVWNDPQPTDLSIAANITRLRIIRNEVYGHCSTARVSDADFEKHWEDITKILCALSNVKARKYYDGLKYSSIDSQGAEKYTRLLEMWFHDSKYFEDSLDQIQAGLTEKASTSDVQEIVSGEIELHIDHVIETIQANFEKMNRNLEIVTENMKEMSSKLEPAASTIAPLCMPSEHYSFDDVLHRGHCHLCGVDLTSEQLARQHLDGKAHAKMLASSLMSHDNTLWFKCDLCETRCNSAENLKMHEQSSSHLKKLKLLSASSSLTSDQPSINPLAVLTSTTPTTFPLRHLVSEEGQNVQERWCDPSFQPDFSTRSADEATSCYGNKTVMSHRSLSSAQPTINPPLLSSSTQTTSPSRLLVDEKGMNIQENATTALLPEAARWCSVCLVHFSGSENAKQHYDSAKHKRKLHLLENPDTLSGQSYDNTVWYRCDVCSVQCNSQEHLENHQRGSSHLKKLKEMSESPNHTSSDQTT